MSYHLVLLPHFTKQLKPLLKKYRGLDESVIEMLEKFSPQHGTLIAPEIYKIRLGTQSLARGKSGAFRLCVYAFELERQIVPITIYFKGDKENLSPKDLEHHTQIILSELQQS